MNRRTAAKLTAGAGALVATGAIAWTAFAGVTEDLPVSTGTASFAPELSAPPATEQAPGRLDVPANVPAPVAVRVPAAVRTVEVEVVRTTTVTLPPVTVTQPPAAPERVEVVVTRTETTTAAPPKVEPTDVTGAPEPDEESTGSPESARG